MSTSVSLNGTTYTIPATGENTWGDNVSSYLIALGSGVLQKAGGSFTLTAEVDFGATYGLKTAYYKSRGTNPASAGEIRLANAEYIKWRNAANSADLGLRVNSSNVLEFNSLPISAIALGTANQVLGMNSGATAQEYKTISGTSNQVTVTHGVGTITLSTPQDIGTGSSVTHASLTLSGLTASRAMVTDGSKVLTSSAVTATELGYLSGVTSPTGSGALVLATSPTLVTPVIGAATGTSLQLSGLTASRAMVTDASKNLASSAVTATELGYLSGVTSPTGSGALVLATSPTLVTPVLGVATATTINKVTLTAPATGSTLTIADGKTLTASNTLTFTGTDSSSVAFGAGGTVIYSGGSPSFAGVTVTGLTASRAVVTDGSKGLASSAATATEVGYLSGVTSAIQTQLDGKASVASAQDSSVDAKNYIVVASVAGNALTLALKTKAGTDPAGGDPVSISFRSATAATGDYTVRTVTAALSMTVSSGSTLGHASATNTYFYLYALDNSGTVELAVSTKLFDQLTVQTSTAEGGAGAADSATTLYSTTARTSKPIRLLARLLSNQTTAGTWAAVPTEISLFNGFVPASATTAGVVPGLPNGQVRCNGGSGYGATGTKTRCYTNSTTVGTAITYTSDSTNGDKFTINEDGVYAITRWDRNTVTAGTNYGLSLNASSAATNIYSLAAAQIICIHEQGVAAMNLPLSSVVRCSAGDIIRAQDGAISGTSSTATDAVQIIVTQVARF